MTSGEHTKGPWETDKIAVRSSGPNGRQICLCEIVVRGRPYDETYDEAIANANLIVTAVNTYPAVAELVEALEMATGALQKLPYSENDVIKFTGKWSDYGSLKVSQILDSANAALSSVKGVER